MELQVEDNPGCDPSGAGKRPFGSCFSRGMANSCNDQTKTFNYTASTSDQGLGGDWKNRTGLPLLRERERSSGDEELQRPHAFQRITDKVDEIDFARVMTVNDPSPANDFGVEVSVAEEKESCALQGPELQPWMLNEHPRGQASGRREGLYGCDGIPR